MPVIIVKVRENVLGNSDKKEEAIRKVSTALAEAIGDHGYVNRTTVIIEEYPNDNWGRSGKQVKKNEINE